MTTRYWRPGKAVRELSARDERFARLVDVIGRPSVELRPSTFESISRSIAYQQLAGAAASAIWGRVTALFPEDGFEPRAVLRKRDTTYRKAGLSGAKTKSIKDLARHITSGHVDPEALHSMKDADVIASLTQVWGIGEWSAQMHLMFSLGRMDVWPTLDLGVRNGYAKYMGRRRAPTAKQLKPLGDLHRPYRSVFAWYMWRVHDVEDWA